MELEDKVREVIKWYIDTYGVTNSQAIRAIERIIEYIKTYN